MQQQDAVRLERFWLRINLFLEDLSGEQLQRLLDGMDLIWATTWGLVDTRLILASSFPPTPKVAGESGRWTGGPRRTKVRQVQDKLRSLARSCSDHSFALQNLTGNAPLVVMLATHEVDVTAALRKTVYEVDLSQFSLYQLLRACDFRTVATEVLHHLHWPVSADCVGRYSFVLAPSGYEAAEETEVQMQDMGTAVATMAHLLHFARQHSDLGDQAVTVVAPAAHWICQIRGVQVTAAMTYNHGERHLGVIPTAQLNCRGDTLRILAWRKPGR